MNKSITFARLSRDYGPVRRATDISDAQWGRAVREGRFMTVYHPENDSTIPSVGLVCHNGFVNAMCKLTFGRKLPVDITEVINMRNDQDAIELCSK